MCHCCFTAGVALSTVLTALCSVCHCYFTAGVALSTVLTALCSVIVFHCYSVWCNAFYRVDRSIQLYSRCSAFYCVDRFILRVSLLLYSRCSAFYCVDRSILRVSLFTALCFTAGVALSTVLTALYSCM